MYLTKTVDGGLSVMWFLTDRHEGNIYSYRYDVTGGNADRGRYRTGRDIDDGHIQKLEVEYMMVDI